MTLEELYMKVASAIQRDAVVDSLCNATFINIDNNKITFKTFIETDTQATAQDLATEYVLPRFIVFWKMINSMWFIEGTDTEEDLNVILKAKSNCKEVTQIIRVDSKSELIEVVRDSNMVSINEILAKKSIRKRASKLRSRR